MRKSNYPRVRLSKQNLSENTYTCGDNSWSAAGLVQYAKDKKYPVFDLPLAGIDLSILPWSDCENLKNLAIHMKRAMESDLKYPVIIDEYGYICDGWHRVMKALALGLTYIKAIRIEKMPRPDGRKEER